jgi:hypothetical protein
METKMIRALLTFAAPAALMALVATPLIGAGIISGPGGEPIMVAASPVPLHQASFDGDCAPARLATGGGLDLGDASGIRVVALSLREGDGGDAVTLREIPAGGSLSGATLLFLFDASGKVLFAGDAADLAAGAAAAEFALDCVPGQAKTPGSV